MEIGLLISYSLTKILKSWIELRRKRATNIMGQFSATPSSSRVMFDEEDNNGLVLCDKYLPVEMLIEIFCHADCKTLLRCQLVCRRWKLLMNHVWHKKTERTLGKPFPWNDKMPWTVYYLACTKKPYERNLVKNPSGAEDFKHWDDGYDWTVEEPPDDMPELPQTEPLFKDRQICFVTSLLRDLEHIPQVQVIILEDEGIHSHILDTYQPPIEVSEWYGCERDHPKEYQLRVTLFRNDDTMIDEFLFRDVLEEEKLNRWLKSFFFCGSIWKHFQSLNVSSAPALSTVVPSGDMAKCNTRLVLRVFKKLHRTRLKTFEGDEYALQVVRDKINNEYRKYKNVTNQAAIEELNKFAQEVEYEVRTTVIQAVETAPGRRCELLQMFW
ncbi:F-box only protein 27 isoform X2 [Temnothorax nylanderi]|uniref:F-box only protein 27 isoform X2 n=1 Tax=Temnothorax nylanderi TaxID=102681 RepID=UPI003A8B3BEF